MRKLYHKCGCAINITEAGACYADTAAPDAPPIEICPGCGQPLSQADLNYSKAQLHALASIYGRLLARAPTTHKGAPR